MDYRRSRNDSHLRVPPLHSVHKYLSTSLSRNKTISRGIRFCSISDQIRWTAHQCGKAMISASAFKRGNVIPKSRSPRPPSEADLFLSRYLKAVIPLTYIGISLIALLLTYTYTSLRCYYRNYTVRRGNTAKLLATTDDESVSSDEQVFVDEEDSDGDNSESTLIESLPQNTNVSIIEDKPAYYRVWVGTEILLLSAEVGLSIFSIIKGEGWRSIGVAGNVEWVYLLLIAMLRFLGTKRTRTLWTHSMLIYLFSWPIAFVSLRSAILKGGKVDLGIQIANMCLVTGLCGVVLTSRAGIKPVKLVSTNGLEPTRVPLPQKVFRSW